ncbi:MAG TPA: ABC transporter permease [Streptosporangiaceae bacterium]|jgi:peptide/nickel transport system permease protein
MSSAESAQPRALGSLVGWPARRLAAAGAGPAVAMVFLVLLAIVAVIAPWIAPQQPDAVNLGSALQPPSAAHWLGTDVVGRDLFSRLLVGARSSLLGPLLVVLIATTAGTALAIVSAWLGGWMDSVISRTIDIGFAFPGLLLAFVAVAVFGQGLTAPVLALSLSYVPFVARVVRGAAIRERHLPYIAACTVQGFSAYSICRRHLLPNVRGIVAAQATLSFGYAMVDLAAISYLGLGVQPPTPDWGLMVSTGQASILQGAPQESIFAGLAIVLTVAAFMVVGQWLADRVPGGSLA